jgi:hypothetical protein
MKKEEIKGGAFVLSVVLAVIAIGFILMDMTRQPESVKQSPLPEIKIFDTQGPVVVRQPARPRKTHCIFAEPQIGPGCRYDDKAMAKVGRDGVKAYGLPEVNTEDNIGN